MKRILATAAALTTLLLTNCNKERLTPATPDSSPESIEATFADMATTERQGPINRPGTGTVINDPLPCLLLEIRKETCFAGGTSLEVLAPGHEKGFFTARRFSFSWNLDGERASNSARLECADGKEAEVTVTYLPTGQKFRAKAELGTGTGGSDR